MGKYREITNQILELYKEGKSGTEIAKALNTSR